MVDGSDKKKCVFIGCKYQDAYFWFNDKSDLGFSPNVELMNYDPDIINKIIERKKPQVFEKGENYLETYYQMYIFKIAQAEVYKIFSYSSNKS